MAEQTVVRKITSGLRRLINVSDISGNGSNGTMTFRFPVNNKYFNLLFRVVSGTVTAAQITNIKLFLNNDIWMQLDASDLDNIAAFEKRTAFGGTVLVIPLELLYLNDQGFRALTAVNTGVAGPKGIISSMRVEFTVTGATNPLFDVWADCMDATPEGPGALPYLVKMQDNVPGTSETTFNKFAMGQSNSKGKLWRRIFMQLASGTMNDFRIMADGSVEVFHAPKAVIDRLATDYQFRTPGATFSYVWDPMVFGSLNVLDTSLAQSLEVKCTASAAAAITFLHQTIGDLN